MKSFRKIALFSCAIIVAATCISIGVLSPSEREVSANYLCVSAKCKAAEAAEAKARQDQANAKSEKNGYQAEVIRINAEIATIQAEIKRNEEEIKELGIRIDNTQKKIDRLMESLKNTIVKLYLSSNVSEFEILASADSVADFTTKSASQGAVQGKVKQLATEAKNAKLELENQKVEVETRKADNESRRAVADARRAEQQAFVDKWKNRESEYSKLADENAAIVAEESRKQYEYNLANFIGNGSADGLNTYTHAYMCPGTQAWAIPNAWGKGYVCQCTSYAGWKAFEYAGYGQASYHTAWGNGGQWAYSAAARGLPVGSEPRAHSIGVSQAGYYGHVFWVEAVSNGIVYISEYNYGFYENFGTRSYSVGASYNAGYQYIYL